MIATTNEWVWEPQGPASRYVKAMGARTAVLIIGTISICVAAAAAIKQGVSVMQTPPALSSQEIAERTEMAENLMDSGDIEGATREYAQLAKATGSGEAYFMHGFGLHLQGKWKAAITEFERAKDADFRAPVAVYNIACANALLGNKEEALDRLEESAALGFKSRTTIINDPDLASLRDDPRFDKVVSDMSAGLDELAEAMLFEPILGEWDVFNGEQQWVGRLYSAPALNGFGVEEHFSGEAGEEIISLYSLDSDTGAWSGLSADSDGRPRPVTIERDGESIRMTTPTHRRTLTPQANGEIIEQIEVSASGEAWTVWQTRRLVPPPSAIAP